MQAVQYRPAFAHAGIVLCTVQCTLQCCTQGVQPPTFNQHTNGKQLPYLPEPSPQHHDRATVVLPPHPAAAARRRAQVAGLDGERDELRQALATSRAHEAEYRQAALDAMNRWTGQPARKGGCEALATQRPGQW